MTSADRNASHVQKRQRDRKAAVSPFVFVPIRLCVPGQKDWINIEYRVYIRCKSQQITGSFCDAILPTIWYNSIKKIQKLILKMM